MSSASSDDSDASGDAGRVIPDDGSEHETEEDFQGVFNNAFDHRVVFEEVDPEEVDGRPVRVVVAFIGPVDAGKSSLIKALFDVDPGDITPLEGSTKRLKYFEHPMVDNVFIVDTPGLQDVIEAHSKVTEDALHKIDLVVFVVDRADATAVSDFAKVTVEWGLPACVVRNKMDLVHPHHRDRVLEQVRGHFDVGRRPKVFGACSGGEPPAVPRVIKPFGLEPILDWIFDRDLSNAQRMRLARALADKDAAARQVVRWSAAGAAAVGALPIPGADLVPLAGIQVTMIRRIGSLYGQTLQDDLLRIFVQQLVGYFARGFYRFLIEAAKGFGWFGGPLGTGLAAALGATVAAATTYGLGKGAIEMSKRELWSDFQANGKIIEEVVKAAVEAYRNRKMDIDHGDESPQE